ncbi:hypothetical protein ABTY20_06800 [Streptomyces sp. NPDC126497]|uniref:hypothetical protein n=1 Tax=Streptomyces sp. NPDC126497 TaxID=3155313 RepID=UPI0033246355
MKVDFTRVGCRLTKMAVEAYGETAGVTLAIPEGWAADTSGMVPGVGGLKDKTTPDRLPGTPLIRLTGSGGVPGVVIRRPNRWERRKPDSNPARPVAANSRPGSAATDASRTSCTTSATAPSMSSRSGRARATTSTTRSGAAWACLVGR